MNHRLLSVIPAIVVAMLPTQGGIAVEPDSEKPPPRMAYDSSHAVSMRLTFARKLSAEMTRKVKNVLDEISDGKRAAEFEGSVGFGSGTEAWIFRIGDSEKLEVWLPVWDRAVPNDVVMTIRNEGKEAPTEVTHTIETKPELQTSFIKMLSSRKEEEFRELLYLWRWRTENG